jgi:hypothetical protein
MAASDVGKGWFYKVLFALTAIQVASIAVMIALPTGQTLPANWGIVQATAMILMVGLHAALRHREHLAPRARRGHRRKRARESFA